MASSLGNILTTLVRRLIYFNSGDGSWESVAIPFDAFAALLSVWSAMS